jgi:glycine oxidase
VSQRGEAAGESGQAAGAPTSRLPEASIAVVGGGLIGMSIAWELARAGWRVVVFEKNLVGGEASWAGAGMLSPGGEMEGPSALASLAIQSRDLYRQFIFELEEASGLVIDYQECGALDLAYSPSELRVLESRAAEQATGGIYSKALSAEHIRTFWPRLREADLAGGRFYANDAIVNPREVMLALAAACRKIDVLVVQRCAATRIRVLETSVEVETACEGGRYEAVVIAAGAWSSSIALEGVPPVPEAEPVKGHLIGYQQPAQTCTTIVRHGGTYLLQRASGLLIAGASVEHVGFDREVRHEVAAGLAERAAFVFPHLGETTPTETWIGFRPGSDAVHIEAWHSKRLYLAYGHYRNGILLAPATAKQIAEHVSANLQMR